MMSPIKFLLKRICGLEEVVWKIPRRLFSACQSFVSERNERSIFESIFWSDASNQFSSHEDIWFEGRYCLVFGPPDIWIKWVYLYWTSILTGFCSREHMVFKTKLFKEFQDGCFMHGHLWYLNGLIWAIIQCLLFALVYAQIDICFWKKDIVWRTEDSCHCGTTQWTGRL